MDSVFKPKILICVECGEEFIFTAGAQEYFAEKGYTEDPKRCKHCYMKHKRDKRNNPVGTESINIRQLGTD
jgi:hypothetical protein